MIEGVTNGKKETREIDLHAGIQRRSDQAGFVWRQHVDSESCWCTDDLCPKKIGTKWGYGNAKGEMVILARFRSAWQFTEGLAPVRFENDKRGYYIDSSGKIVLSTNFDIDGPFSEGIAIIGMEDPKEWEEGMERNKRYYGYMNRAGKVIIPL